jgi:uncharacterized protein HemX
MGRLIVVVVIVALLIGGLAGVLWWGRSARQTAELSAARQHADDLEQKLREAERRLATAETDLRRTNEMNVRLHMLVSEGKK